MNTQSQPESVAKEARQLLTLMSLASELDARVLHALERTVEKRLGEQPPLRVEDVKPFLDAKAAEYTDVLRSMREYRSVEKRAETSAIGG